MRRISTFPSTVRWWLLYGVLTGALTGAGLYLFTTDHFEMIGLVGSTLTFVVAMVAVGQILRLMVGISDPDAKRNG